MVWLVFGRCGRGVSEKLATQLLICLVRGVLRGSDSPISRWWFTRCSCLISSFTGTLAVLTWMNSHMWFEGCMYFPVSYTSCRIFSSTILCSCSIFIVLHFSWNYLIVKCWNWCECVLLDRCMTDDCPLELVGRWVSIFEFLTSLRLKFLKNRLPK